MEILELNGTCSMAELANVNVEDIMIGDFNALVRDAIEEYKDRDEYEVFWDADNLEVLLYNTIFSLEKREKLKKLGWRQVLTYKGNEGRVYSFVKHINKI